MDTAGDLGDGGSDVERYEALRARALGGDPEGWRLGLGVLCRRGVAGWLHAWRTLAPAPAVGEPTAVDPVGSEELVSVLASMALAALGG